MMFPENPTDGQIFEIQNGVIFVYDQSMASWVQISTGRIPLQLATENSDGALSADDFNKLNNLVIPPPQSTITTDNCSVTFSNGLVSLKPKDDYIKIEGDLSTSNIDEFGNTISKDLPFKIHDYTYGLNFRLDLPTFIADMNSLGKVSYKGKTGNQGDQGAQGDQGVSRVYTGPQGNKGQQGLSIPCGSYKVEPEAFPVTPSSGLNMALVSAELVTDSSDTSKKKVIFHRKVVGTETPASALTYNNTDSPWLIVLDNNGGNPQAAYYIDIDSIMDTIYNTYINQVNALKSAYESVVQSYVALMSQKFDQQKDALCCALEKCMSVTKNNDARQHMENVAATAVGKAKIILRGRNDPTAVSISGMHTMPTTGNPDDCTGSGGGQFPVTPTFGDSNVGGCNVPPNIPNAPTTSSSSFGLPPVSSVPSVYPSSSASSIRFSSSSSSPMGVPTGSSSSASSSSSSSSSGGGGGGVGGGDFCGSTVTIDLADAVQHVLDDINSFNRYADKFTLTDISNPVVFTIQSCLPPYVGPFVVQMGKFTTYLSDNTTGVFGLSIEIVMKKNPASNGINDVTVTAKGKFNTFTAWLKTSDDTIKVNFSYGMKQTAARSIPTTTVKTPVHLQVSLNNSILTSKKVTLPEGEYNAKIIVSKGNSGGFFRSDVKFSYRLAGKKKYSEFQFRGQFESETDARDVYEGSAVSFNHSGGETEWWFPVEPGTQSTGFIDIEIEKIENSFLVKQVGSCSMSVEKIKWYEKAWQDKECCGCMINYNGQDYVIMKKSIGDDLSCGGEESREEPCIEVFSNMGHPAFAFPTFDGHRFLITDQMMFKYDQTVDADVKKLISDGKSYKKLGRQKYDLVLLPYL